MSVTSSTQWGALLNFAKVVNLPPLSCQCTGFVSLPTGPLYQSRVFMFQSFYSSLQLLPAPTAAGASNPLPTWTLTSCHMIFFLDFLPGSPTETSSAALTPACTCWHLLWGSVFYCCCHCHKLPSHRPYIHHLHPLPVHTEQQQLATPPPQLNATNTACYLRCHR